MKDESLIEVNEATNSEVREVSKEPKKAEVKQEENFATEIFKAFKAQSRFMIGGLVIALVVSIASSAIWAIVYFRNDDKWRDLFSSYDYVTQDGEGINNINSGSQGDLHSDTDAE